MFAATVGVPAATAQRQWRMRRAIVHAGAPLEPVAVVPRRANFAVVVPTTRDAQLRVERGKFTRSQRKWMRA